jgi:hypothetical protein
MLGSAAYQDAQELKTGYTDTNWIVDGDLTQWPDGTSQTGLGALKAYVSALWFSQLSSTVGRGTGSRVTDVPTLAESGHQSAYSLKWDCTTIDASPTGSDLLSYVYVITGSDYANLHGGKEMTFSFWHKHTKTGVQSGSFQNSARNRSYVFTYEQTVSNTWEKATINFTTDTSGTWLFTEADVGMRISLLIMTGDAFSDTTADTWLAQDERGHGNQVNNVDSTSNNMLFSQFCLRFGDSGEFTSPPIAAVQDKVAYYVEKIGPGADNHESFGSGVVYTSGDAYCHGPKYQRKRIVPAVSVEGSNPLLRIFAGTNVQSCTVHSFQSVGYTECRSRITPSTSNLAGGYGCWYGGAGGNAYLLIDARH